MATNKTLTPTNVTIQIPDFTDQPDQRVNSNCIDKEADAINALNSKITTATATFTTNADSNIDFGATEKRIIGIFNNTYYCQMVFWFNGHTYAKMKATTNSADVPNMSMTITYVTYNV